MKNIWFLSEKLFAKKGQSTFTYINIICMLQSIYKILFCI